MHCRHDIIDPTHPTAAILPDYRVLRVLVIRLLCVIVTLTAFPLVATASDLARERRLAEQIVDAILDGEPVTLTAGDTEFLGIYTEPEALPGHGAAIILHGRGTHPDWSQVAGPLRIGLPAYDWTTLSLQMPVLSKEARYYDYVQVLPEAVPRIEAGIDFLETRGHDRIILIAHSCSVHMGMAWLEAMGDAHIDAFVGIGMGATDYGQPMKKPFPFGRLQVPLLNIRGSDDYPAVQRLAAELAPRLGGMHPLSAQLEVAGADHYFNETADKLLESIAGWLEGLLAADK